MPTRIAEVQELRDELVVTKLRSLRIATLEQFLPRIRSAAAREQFEELLGVPLGGLFHRDAAILAGIPKLRRAHGALVPAGSPASPGRAATPIASASSGSPPRPPSVFPRTPKLPARVDLSPLALPVRDQGNDRLTCVAFATCAALEILARRGDHFSPQHLYWQCKQRDVPPWNAHCGTFVDTAVTSLGLGVCDELAWRYDLHKAQCPDDHAPPPSSASPVPWTRGFYPIPCTDLVKVKTALSNGHPVVASLRTFHWWLQTDFLTGDITSPLPGDEPDNEGHAICIVGYEDNADGSGDGVLLFKNSWGLGFGATAAGGWRDGYGRVGYRYIVGYPGRGSYAIELVELT